MSIAPKNKTYTAMLKPLFMHRYETWFAVENDEV
jgi:hypothetical protein